MKIDIGNALAPTASPGVTEQQLHSLDERVRPIHERIVSGMENDECGYAALSLPETLDRTAIEDACASLPEATHVLLAGIGGSALGAATIADVLGSGHRLHVFDNVDPQQTAQRLADIPLDDAVLIIVSRSGTTTETIANAMILSDAMDRAGLAWNERTLVVTGPDGPLREAVDRHGLASLPVPDGVPGRFSALSTMGLAPIVALGHDIETLRRGGADASKSLTDSLFACPAYAFGATSYALATEGALINAMMPYAEPLDVFAEWFAQLWAESLGKDEKGQIPARALGVTDQHSQLQLYRAGPARVQTSFLVVNECDGPAVPDAPSLDIKSAVTGTPLEELIRLEQRATEGSLAAAGRPNIRLEIDRLNGRSLGHLLVSMEAACIMAAELFAINPFDQPAVEWAKRAIRAELSGEPSTETAAIQQKRTLQITPSSESV